MSLHPFQPFQPFHPFRRSVGYPRFWLMALTATRGDAPPQMSEFEFIGAVIASISVTNSFNSAAESIEKLIDGDTNTKWYRSGSDSWLTNLSTITFDLGDNPQRVSGYRWFSANDVPDRDPVSWIIYASQDGETWDLRHEVNNADIPLARKSLAYSHAF